jgi:carbon-monoxide dehydrogenase medium subunit
VKAAPFTYHRPGDAEELLSEVSELGEDAKVLAGGQSLIPLLALRLTRFDHLIDINRVAGLSGIEVVDGEVRVGATTRQSDVIKSTVVREALPLLPIASSNVGHFQIRNRGTIGGSIAHADPAAEYPAVSLALDATMLLRSAGGERAVPASEFFVSTFMTSAEPDEVLTEVRFPVWGDRSGFGVSEAARRSGDFAIAGAVAGVQLSEDGRIARTAVALFGTGPAPLRASSAEAALTGRATAELTPDYLSDVGRSVAGELDPPSDVHASSRYRAHLGGVMVTRSLTDALAAAGAGRS